MTLVASEGKRTPSLAPVSPSTRSPHLGYLDRIDPIHEIEFRDVVGSRWDEAAIVEHALSVSPSGALMHVNKAVSSPIALSAARLYTPLTIRAVAVLVQFHQASTHQITTLSGSELSKVSSALHRLYAAGVIQRSSNNKWPHASKDDRNNNGVGEIWQLNYTSPRLGEWLDGLSDLEYGLMSGGKDILKGTNGAGGSSSIRHNLTLVEIAVRAIEMCPGVIGSWGEPMTTSDMFTESLEKMRSNIADGAIIGKDGSIILLETSGVSNLDHEAAGHKLSEKALGWAAVSARTELPLKVIFVNISTRAKMQRFYFHIQKGISRVDEHIVKSSAQQKGRESVFCADALDWFPFTLGVAKGFTELEAYSTETRRFHNLIPADTELNPKADVIANTLGALHMPPWITS